MTSCRIELLGGFHVQQEGHRISRFRTQRAGVLLAYLAFYRVASHSREALADLLWPEDDPDTARERLRVVLASLRRQLEPPGVPAGSVLVASRSTVQLNPAAVSTDVADFQGALMVAAQAGSNLAHAHHLAEAVEIYRGELLPGYLEEWVLEERQRLADAFLQALRQLTRHWEQTGDLSRAIEYARRAVSAEPLAEEAHHDLMRLLAAAGQPEAALRQYLEMERILEQELGEVPEAGSRELARQIKQQPRQRPVRPPQGPVSPGLAHAEDPSRPGRSANVARLAPLGTFTFLLAEFAGASPRRDRGGDAFHAALSHGLAALRSAFCRHQGQELRHTGDSLLAAFPRAADALAAAVAAQEVMANEVEPPAIETLGVRMALHTADVDFREEAAPGPLFHRLTRLLLAAHPGQILVSEGPHALLQENLAPGLHLRELGSYRLRSGAAPERLFQVEYPGMVRSRFSPPHAALAHEGSLPAPPHRFFGREAEMRQLQELLAGKARLLTLTGPGGSGKTRLSIEVARRLQPAFHGAVWFVPLADLPDARLIAGKLLETLRLPRSPDLDPLEQVVAFLSRQRSLLVLDNFEHLIAQGAPVVRTLLKRLPTLTCLVTSRRRLRLAGEQEFALAPLPLPTPVDGEWSGTGEAGGADGPTRASRSSSSTISDQLSTLAACPSVELFVDRAQAVRPDFQITAANAAAVADLCRRLEGLPLALELAAARVLALPPKQMLARLDDRFALLVSGRRRTEARHRSLRAALDWSYQLLPPELQRFFARLSVFRGDFRSEAAAIVCAERCAQNYLARLSEASLVLSERCGPEMRYRLLETLREHGAEQLSPEARQDLGRRHAEYFAALVEQEEPRALEVGWLERLEVELGNLRAALAWCQSPEGDEELGLRVAAALSLFWMTCGPPAEDRRWLEGLLNRGGEPCPSVLAKALLAAARLAYREGDYGPATRHGEGSVGLYRELADRENLADALVFMGELAVVKGEYERAAEFLEEALPLCRAAGNQEVLARALDILGNLAIRHGDYSRARELKEESLHVMRQTGRRERCAGALGELGYVLAVQGDYERARALFEEQLAIFREFKVSTSIPRALWHLGRVAMEQGHYDQAREWLGESVALHRPIGHRSSLADALTALGTLAGYQAGYAEARALHEEALALRQELSDRWDVANSLDRLGWVALHQGDLTGARCRLEESLALYRQVGDKRGIASSLYNLARLALIEDGPDAARSGFVESLALRREVGEMRGIAECLEGLAAVASEEGPVEQAARLFGAAEALREALGAPLPPVDRGAYQSRADAVRAAVGEEAFAAGWAEGRAMTPEQTAADALAGTAH